jgi:peroxiredoxin Q/BCP
MAQAVAPIIQTQLKIGDRVPHFELPYATREKEGVQNRISSDDLQGKRYLIAFHPADWSDVCTKQAQGFRENLKAFKDFGIEVLLVSGDYVFSRHEWAKSLNLPFYLLSDHKHTMGKAFGIYDDATGFDTRSVFLIGKDGRIEYVNSSYNAEKNNDFIALQGAISRHKS